MGMQHDTKLAFFFNIVQKTVDRPPPFPTFLTFGSNFFDFMILDIFVSLYYHRQVI